MRSVLLFSQLTDTNKQSILNVLFLNKAGGKTFAYMPSSGVQGSEDYIAEWESIADGNSTKFVVIDNTSSDTQEHDKLLASDVLLISGGNTFTLLHNLRESGLDKTIIEFSQKQNIILAGFSAGALILTPTIEICNLPGFNENLVNLEDMHGLGIVDFEIFPHYEKYRDASKLSNYRKRTSNDVREVTNEDYVLLDL